MNNDLLGSKVEFYAAGRVLVRGKVRAVGFVDSKFTLRVEDDIDGALVTVGADVAVSVRL